jgi:hypothetical protein
MKRFAFILILLAFCCTTATWSQEGHLSKKELIAQKIADQLNNKTFKVMVQWAYPMVGSPVSLTSLYSLEIKGDSVKSYLPYYGRATNIPYGGGKGLNFEAKITDYKVRFGRRNRAEVHFTSQNEEDTYNFSLLVFLNGSTCITVVSRNRDIINFQGEAVVDLQTTGVNSKQ